MSARDYNSEFSIPQMVETFRKISQRLQKDVILFTGLSIYILLFSEKETKFFNVSLMFSENAIVFELILLGLLGVIASQILKMFLLFRQIDIEIKGGFSTSGEGEIKQPFDVKIVQLKRSTPATALALADSFIVDFMFGGTKRLANLNRLKIILATLGVIALGCLVLVLEKQKFYLSGENTTIYCILCAIFIGYLFYLYQIKLKAQVKYFWKLEAYRKVFSSLFKIDYIFEYASRPDKFQSIASVEEILKSFDGYLININRNQKLGFSEQKIQNYIEKGKSQIRVAIGQIASDIESLRKTNEKAIQSLSNDKITSALIDFERVQNEVLQLGAAYIKYWNSIKEQEIEIENSADNDIPIGIVEYFKSFQSRFKKDKLFFEVTTNLLKNDLQKKSLQDFDKLMQQFQSEIEDFWKEPDNNDIAVYCGVLAKPKQDG